jgi:hypothetical protein
MKIANVKGMVAKAMAVGLAAGALMFAAPAKATAQGFAVGVQIGRPYYGYDRFEFARRQEFLRREEFRRHEEWQRAHRFDRPFGYR